MSADTHSQDQATSSTQPPKQKSKARLVVGVASIIVVLVLILPITNLFVRPVQGTPVTQAAAAHPDFAAAAQILEQNCFDCHSELAKLPFYANFPVARTIVSADMAKGTRFFSMTQELVPSEDETYNEAALAQLEYALDSHEMPPTRYVMLHWDRALSTAEKQTVLDAIHAIRQAHFTTPGVAPEFATHMLQPLPDGVDVNAQQAELGQRMYHDLRLSGDDTLSCASCHGLATGGCDRVAVSTGIDGQQGPINSPTVYNSVFNLAQFWDGRAQDLEDQASGPVHNPLEMGSNWEQVLGKLRDDAEVVAAFEAAYPDGLTGPNIAHAIAEFEKTLVTPGSKFDQYLSGDATALSDDEVAGLRLFEQNACAACHVGKAVGGQSYELMGRSQDYFARRGGELTDADLGRYNVTKNERDKHKFKTPLLRNIALTYPYFHDASETTLAGAVRVMAQVNGYRDFTEEEIAQVLAFLHTLTGKFNGELLQ